MPHGMVYYPPLKSERLDLFRERYDPTAKLIKPHLTIMFIIPDTVGRDMLVSHLQPILDQVSPFELRIRGLTRSWDHWLFLTLAEGNEQVTEIFEQVYSGPLAEFRRDDIEFVPHIAIGFFAVEPESYDHSDPQQLAFDEATFARAWEEAQQLEIDQECTVDRLHLVEFNSDLSQILDEQEFQL